MPDPTSLPDGWVVVEELPTETFEFTGSMQYWNVPDANPGLSLWVEASARGARGAVDPLLEQRQNRSFASAMIEDLSRRAAFFAGVFGISHYTSLEDLASQIAAILGVPEALVLYLIGNDPRWGSVSEVQVGGDGIGSMGGWPNGGNGGGGYAPSTGGYGGAGGTGVRWTEEYEPFVSNVRLIEAVGTAGSSGRPGKVYVGTVPMPANAYSGYIGQNLDGNPLWWEPGQGGYDPGGGLYGFFIGIYSSDHTSWPWSYGNARGSYVVWPRVNPPGWEPIGPPNEAAPGFGNGADAELAMDGGGGVGGGGGGGGLFRKSMGGYATDVGNETFGGLHPMGVGDFPWSGGHELFNEDGPRVTYQLYPTIYSGGATTANGQVIINAWWVRWPTSTWTIDRLRASPRSVPPSA